MPSFDTIIVLSYKTGLSIGTSSVKEGTVPCPTPSSAVSASCAAAAYSGTVRTVLLPLHAMSG